MFGLSSLIRFFHCSILGNFYCCASACALSFSLLVELVVVNRAFGASEGSPRSLVNIKCFIVGAHMFFLWSIFVACLVVYLCRIFSCRVSVCDLCVSRLMPALDMGVDCLLHCHIHAAFPYFCLELAVWIYFDHLFHWRVVAVFRLTCHICSSYIVFWILFIFPILGVNGLNLID